MKFLVTEVIDFSSNITNWFHLSSQISISNFILRESNWKLALNDWTAMKRKADKRRRKPRLDRLCLKTEAR